MPTDAVNLRTQHGGFWFDAADQKLTPWILSQATWEEDVGRLFRSTVQPGMTAVDVGANIGFHTVALSRLVGSAGAVHAFEPMPSTLDLLVANLWRHECVNTVVHRTAVTDRRGTVTMRPDSDGLSGAALGEGDITVDAQTLDEALPDTIVDVMKVDVEGAEPLVFKGAQRLLERSPNVLAVVEFRNAQHLDGSGPEEVLELYASLDFRPHLMTPDGRAVPARRDDILREAERVETINFVLRKP